MVSLVDFRNIELIGCSYGIGLIIRSKNSSLINHLFIVLQKEPMVVWGVFKIAHIESWGIVSLSAFNVRRCQFIKLAEI